MADRYPGVCLVWVLVVQDEAAPSLLLSIDLVGSPSLGPLDPREFGRGGGGLNSEEGVLYDLMFSLGPLTL